MCYSYLFISLNTHTHIHHQIYSSAQLRCHISVAILITIIDTIIDPFHLRALVVSLMNALAVMKYLALEVLINLILLITLYFVRANTLHNMN